MSEVSPLVLIFQLFCFVGFYVKLTLEMSHGVFEAKVIEEDLKCPSVHFYFRHKQAPV
jgi:hypothetical protein